MEILVSLLEQSLEKSLRNASLAKKSMILSFFPSIPELDLLRLTNKWAALSDGGSPMLNRNNREKFRQIIDRKGDWEKESFHNLSQEIVDNLDSRSDVESREIVDSIDIGIKDFEFLKLISKGAYGRVWLTKRKSTGDLYAMKIVNFAEKVLITKGVFD